MISKQTTPAQDTTPEHAQHLIDEVESVICDSAWGHLALLELLKNHQGITDDETLTRAISAIHSHFTREILEKLDIAYKCAKDPDFYAYKFGCEE